MAYDKKKIFQQAKEAIIKHKLYFIEDIVAFLPIAKKTYYEYFPLESDESNELREMLEINKIQTKSSIRTKLHNSDKAAELLALYRLLATPEEHQRLNQSYIDHTTKGKEINMPISNWADGNVNPEI
jgi:hypothetical protein